ncbi:invasion associated locus B family protein [Aquabacter spiritensis]|uniref:Invasion associated locus B (IalB) protein n=1 Tax=Aquabacter spiritensis TaxID=933073 RepID=A0A4R3M078_9HYPH|nr:invasion associated locus B family protein [Aquabacter spiritensis]TCT05559.1 hypothetical protein EDC64_104116 [Aquabacter spiritensis]
MLTKSALPALFLLASGPALATVPESAGSFQDWSAWVYKEGGRPHCYIYAQAVEKAPARLDHGDVSFFVRSVRQAATKTEASLNVGYDFQPGSTVRAAIGDETFQLMVKGQNAWLPTAEEEDDLLAAMKGGSEMSIRATSRRGNPTSYTFSLDGVTAAIQQMQKQCP